MITSLIGCVGTKDLTPWETEFVQSLYERMEAGQVTRLTDNQVGTLERLYRRHFA
jgi:hypothetical protein